MRILLIFNFLFKKRNIPKAMVEASKAASEKINKLGAT